MFVEEEEIFYRRAVRPRMLSSGAALGVGELGHRPAPRALGAPRLGTLARGLESRKWKSVE